MNKPLTEEQQTIVKKNLNLVWKLVGETKRKTACSPNDMFQAGAMGLMYAVQKYNPDRGATLATYAYPKIIKCIYEEIYRQKEIIQIPKDMRKRFRIEEELTKQYIENGLEINEEELAEAIGISTKALKRGSTVYKGAFIVSIDRRARTSKTDADDEFETIQDQTRDADQLSQEQQVLLAEQNKIIRETIKNITDKTNHPEINKTILNTRIYDNSKTLSEIGETYNLTRQAIKCIEAKLKRRIQAALHTAEYKLKTTLYPRASGGM